MEEAAETTGPSWLGSLIELGLEAVVVFGPPAVCGWVPLPADEGLPGVAAGSLTIVEPVETPSTVRTSHA